MNRLILFVLGCASAAALAAGDAAPGCQRLRLVLDRQLSAELVQQEWGSGHTRLEQPARIELVGCDGQVLDRLVLASPLARLDPLPVRGAARPTWLATADLTAEAGSYNGPSTTPVEIAENRLQAAVALREDGLVEPIRLAMTGKSAWRRVARDGADDFLSVSSQPAKDGFVTYYRHYFLSGQQWRAKVRAQSGLWESDAGFPSRDDFPD